MYKFIFQNKEIEKMKGKNKEIKKLEKDKDVEKFLKNRNRLKVGM
jgi:hypothetical protein